MKKLLSLALTILAINTTGAQTITPGQDEIIFHSTEAINNGNTLNISNDFIIRGADHIEWSQDDDVESVQYDITGMIGHWADLNETGAMEFTVKLNNRTGKIHLYRSSPTVLKLQIDMYRDAVNLVPFEFVISSFEKLN